MTHSTLRERMRVSTVVLLLAGSASGQDFFTPFGTGCASGSGTTPAIGMTGYPALGQAFSVDLHSAPPFVPASLAIGVSNQSWLGLPLPLDLGLVLGFPGCTLWISPDLNVPSATDGSGTAHVPAVMPTNLSLLGAQFYNQWVVLTPVGTLAFSDGSASTVGERPPVAILSVSPPTGPVGTTVTVVARNVGRNNPDDLCLRVMDPRGDTSLLRVTSIAVDPVTGDDLLTATLVTASELPPLAGPVGIMRGTGMQPMLNPTPALQATSAWGWYSSRLPGEAGQGGSFTPVPQPSRANEAFQLVSGGALATFPGDPLGNGGTYDPGLRIRIEVHIHYSSCRWFDIVIDLGTTGWLSALAMTSEVGVGFLQPTLDQALGAGRAVVIPNGLDLQIQSGDPADPFVSVVGHVIVD